MKTVLTIQSQVAGAPVGNSVAVFAMERLGVRALALPTTLLGRRPDRGPPGGAAVSAETLTSMLDALEADGQLARVDAVLSGYLALSEQAAVVLDAVERVKAANKKAIYACDPVMGDGGLYVKPDVADAVIGSLLPAADLACPNLWEASRMAGRDLVGLEDARNAARRFGRPMLITSIPTATGLGVLYAAPTGDWLAETPRLPAKAHGTGDLLSALFVARRVKGEGAAVALEAATGAVYDCIVRALAAGVDDLFLAESQEVLADPQTWPRALRLEH